jgi:hypothetical protein
MHSGFLASLALTFTLAGCASAPSVRAIDTTLSPNLSRYHAIAVDSVTVAPAVAIHLSPEQVRNLERDLRLAIVDSLPPQARAVSPAPGVVRLSLTVTDLDATNPTLNGISTALILVPIGRGSVEFEVAFADAPGATPFARTTRFHQSSMVDLKDNFRRYRHATSAVREWAGTLAGSLSLSPLTATVDRYP